MAIALALALVLIAIAAEGNRGIIIAGDQSPPSPNSPSLSCGASSLASLVPCLGFLLSGTNTGNPTQGCCAALASVVDSSAVCVCQLFTTSNSPLGIPIKNIPLGIPINQNRGLTLAGACKITTPSLSQCISAAVSNTPPLPATSSPSPAPTSSDYPTANSPATSVYPSATTGGILAPSGSHEGPTASSNAAGSMISYSLSSMLIVGLILIISARIIV